MDVKIGEKFCALEAVAERKFYDLVVQVVRQPFHSGDRVTLWVTDYTANPTLLQLRPERRRRTRMGRRRGADRTTRMATRASSRPCRRATRARAGPARSAGGPCKLRATSRTRDFVRRNVVAGQWVRLRNVQVKFGSNQENLEGFLRQDQRHVQDKIYVDVLDPLGGSDKPDERLKEALRRKTRLRNGAEERAEGASQRRRRRQRQRQRQQR